MAVDEINAMGGADGKKIVVTDKDNKSETVEAATAYKPCHQSKVNALLDLQLQVLLQQRLPMLVKQVFHW